MIYFKVFILGSPGHMTAELRLRMFAGAGLQCQRIERIERIERRRHHQMALIMALIAKFLQCSDCQVPLFNY
jgi:hypothetical protein